MNIMTTQSRSTGTSQVDQLKGMFRRQWVNGDFKTYLKSLKRRIKEVYGVEITADTPDDLYDELLRIGLISTIEK